MPCCCGREAAWAAELPDEGQSIVRDVELAKAHALCVQKNTSFVPLGDSRLNATPPEGDIDEDFPDDLGYQTYAKLVCKERLSIANRVFGKVRKHEKEYFAYIYTLA